MLKRFMINEFLQIERVCSTVQLLHVVCNATCNHTKKCSSIKTELCVFKLGLYEHFVSSFISELWYNVHLEVNKYIHIYVNIFPHI